MDKEKRRSNYPLHLWVLKLFYQLVEDLAVVIGGGDKKISKADIGGVVRFIGHGADAEEWHFVDLAGVRDGGGFHIYREGIVDGEELTGFFNTADELVSADDATFVYFGGVSANFIQ